MPQINFHHVDCMDFMRGLPDNAYDLAIVDPPYGINYDVKASKNSGTKYGVAKTSKTVYKNTNWDKVTPDAEYFSELFRISQNQIIWGWNYYVDFLKSAKCYIVWYKRMNGNFGDCEQAWASFDRPPMVFDFMWNGMLQSDMKNKERRIHPTQKPVALYRWCLENYAKKGDKILDTHGGSMSSAIACHDLGFDLDICELDADYFKAGKERFERHVNRWHEGLNTPIKDNNDYSTIGIFANAL